MAHDDVNASCQVTSSYLYHNNGMILTADLQMCDTEYGDTEYCDTEQTWPDLVHN